MVWAPRPTPPPPSPPPQSALTADAAARAASIPAITSAGVFPGLSGLLAAAMRDDAALEGAGPYAADAAPSSVSRIRYAYYVAGSGGAGPAVLAATMLLAGTPVAAWRDRARVEAGPWSQPLPADFGPGVGVKEVYLVDLPEVEAAATVLGAASVSARFATAPAVFNLGMRALASFGPRAWVTDPAAAAAVAAALAPLVAAGDALVGGKIAMRIDLETAAGGAATALFQHKDMATAVG